MSSQGPSQGGDKTFSQSVAGDLVRPRYSPGLILEDSDLTAAVDYTRDLSRLLFRTLFGSGVLCGLTVSVEPDPELAVTVAPGLALNGCGDPVQLASSVTIKLGRGEGARPEPDAAAAGPKPGEFWVVLCGGERRCAPRELVCDADEFDVRTQPTRIRTTAEVSIVFERPEGLCQCEPAEAGQVADCHKEHNRRIDCPPDGGCCVLLARVHWVDKQTGWRPIHVGERRFLRPVFGPDPMTDGQPLGSNRIDKK
jgi:hypothetical protein